MGTALTDSRPTEENTVIHTALILIQSQKMYPVPFITITDVTRPMKREALAYTNCTHSPISIPTVLNKTYFGEFAEIKYNLFPNWELCTLVHVKRGYSCE